MRKAERLFQLITLLRGRRLAITANKLAEMLEVSERTIYRDIQALMLSGVPIEGEAGVGYLLDRSFELPPLMFTVEEMLALLVGSKMVEAWGDNSLAVGAHSAFEKITAILPDKLKSLSERSPIFIPRYFRNEQQAELNKQVRNAIETHHQLSIDYIDAKNTRSKRIIEPLGLVFWGNKWTIIAYCQLRNNYREFRLDRISQCDYLETTFTVSEVKNMNHYIFLMETTKCSE
ncbi:helix-turn-helix transcriptional regulator [Colwelliaceae bacterium 6441]